MKKTPKKVTLQTLNKRFDSLGQKVDTLVTTVDNLAIATNRGFENTVSKTEFKDFKKEMTDFKEDMTDFAKKAEVTLFSLDSHARTTNERLGAIEKALPPLGNLSEAIKREVLQLNVRVGRIETKVGIKTS